MARSNKPSVAERFKGLVKMERPWFVLIAAAMVLATFIGAFSIYQLRQEPAAVSAEADTKAVQRDVETTPGGNATKEYREKIDEYNERQAAKASEEGKSFIPSPQSSSSRDNEQKNKDQLKQDVQENSSTQDKQESSADSGSGNNQQVNPRMQALQHQLRQMRDQLRRISRNQRRRSDSSSGNEKGQESYQREELVGRYDDQIARLSSEMQSGVAEQKVYTFASASPQQTTQSDGQAGETARARGQSQSGSDMSAGSSSEAEEEKPELEINPGDILYARNEMRLNSDVGGPAQATILSGKYQGAKLLGGFEKKSDYLRVEFGRLVTPEGRQYSVQAYAINPEVSSTAVRSDVDRHMLQRWGGLMAASFLSGFGKAVSQGGTSVTVSDGTTTKSYPDMDINQQLWSAGGDVGKELAAKFDENFNRPSTVTLKSGQKLGILIVSTEN